MCGKYFAESTGTIFYRSRLASELLCRIITVLAEGVGLHATVRIFGVDPNTILACLVKAAEQSDNFSARWTGRASIAAGSYTFIAGADDGIRVRLDGNLIIDQWRDQGYTEFGCSLTNGNIPRWSPSRPMSL